MSAFLTIVRKEWRAVLREKTILIAILIQLFIASFSSALLVGLLSIYDPDTMTVEGRVDMPVGVMGDLTSPLITFLRESQMKVTPFTDAKEAERAFKADEVVVILYVPEDKGGTMDMKMYLPRSEVISSLIQVYLHEPLKLYENYLRTERGVVVHFTELQGLSSTTFEFLYGVLIPLLMLFPAFVGGSLVIDSLSEELETRTFETLWSAPLSLNTILAAKISAALVIAVIQCLFWLALLRLNHIDIQNLALVLLLATLTAAILLSVCAFITMALRDRERSQFLYALFMLVAGSLTYFFDSGPIQLTTRLAIGDYYTGAVDVAKYAVVLVALLFVLFRGMKRLLAA